MARIPLVDLGGGEPPEDDGDARSPLEAGALPNILRAIANHPRATEAFGAFGGFIYGGTSLTPAQRELAYLTASAVNECHY